MGQGDVQGSVREGLYGYDTVLESVGTQQWVCTMGAGATKLQSCSLPSAKRKIEKREGEGSQVVRKMSGTQASWGHFRVGDSKVRGIRREGMQ